MDDKDVVEKWRSLSLEEKELLLAATNRKAYWFFQAVKIAIWLAVVVAGILLVKYVG
jgi:hypothetical protein